MQELVAWARGVVERQLKVPQGRTLGRASESPGMDSLARSWRSSPWLQHLQGSLEHAPAASACSADCCALPAARRSRAVDIVDIFLQRIDGNRKRLEEASGSARASTGCNHRPSGTSGGPCGPAGAIGGVCACVPGVGPGGSFTTLRMSISYYVSIYYICQRSARASQPRAADGIHERALLGGGLRASAPSIVHTLEAGISTSTTQR